MKKALVLLLPFLIVFSCSVQKRKYQKGFYVSRKHQSPTEKPAPVVKATGKPAAASTKAVVLKAEQPETTVASVKPGNELTLIKQQAKPSVFTKDEPCDDLIFKDGTELKAKITEITTTEIKYKRCDQLEGPLYVARKSDVFMIKYANGTREVFKNETVTPATQNPERSAMVNDGYKKTHPLAILSLIFSILGIYPLFLIGSILAIIFANIALRRIKANPNYYKGDTLAEVGRTIGIVLLSIIGLAIIIAIVALLLVA